MNEDPAVMEFFPGTLTPNETGTMLQRIEDHFEKYGYGLYVVDLLSTGAFLGFTGFPTPPSRAGSHPVSEIGWRLKKEAWGQGYATLEAASACLQYGCETFGFDKVLSFTAAINKRSERIMQKIGMTHSGVFDHPGVEEGHALRPHVLYEYPTASNPRRLVDPLRSEGRGVTLM